MIDVSAANFQNFVHTIHLATVMTIYIFMSIKIESC